MKRRLAAIYWLGILITLVMAFVAIGVAAKLKIDDTHASLTAMLNAASRWTLDSNEDLQKLADEIAGVAPPMRVTFLLNSGLVLADSVEDGDPAVNHRDDEEIAAARKGKIGESLRVSPADATVVLYMARRLSPQLILRVSYPVLEIAETLAVYGAAILALFLVLFLFQRHAVARFARDQSRQMEDVRRLLDGEIERVEAVFPEFQPLLNAIAYRVERLREDYQEIIRTMQLRSNFVANASHELRSPLTSVRGFAEMLSEGLAETPEERALCLDTILGECDRMLQVIEDILQLGRAERDREALTAAIDAAPIAREVARSLQPQAAERSIAIHVEGDAAVRVDERELWEILYNLADNAVRYGRPNGNVWIRMDGGRIAVEDDGIGIPGEHLGHIFEAFYRVDERRESERRGTGLGLSIVKAIVEQRGGNIAVESRPNEGTRFILSFDAGD